MKPRLSRSVAVLLSLGLLAAACGSDRTDESATTTTAPVATGSGTGVTAATTTTAVPGVKFGTMDSPCGKGTAAGATATGVTDTKITIGFGDDAGYAAAPGLSKEMADAMKVIIAWCNEQGGINGRQIDGKYYDAKLLEIDKAMTQACNDKVFMMVGQGWAFDAGQEKIRIDCKLPSIPGYSVSANFAMGPGVRQTLPNPADQVTLSAAYQLATLFPDAVKKAAFVFAEYPPTRETRDKYEAGYPSAGWSFLKCDQVYGIAGEPDWKPFASALKACGVEAVVWVGSANPNFQNLLTAAKQVGFTPKLWNTDANHYDSSFIKWNADNGGVADAVYVRMAVVPFEEADKNPGIKQYVDLMSKSSGSKQGLLGVQSFGSFLLFATGVKACGSTVTAKCVLAEIDKLKDWTAGGMQTPTTPGVNATPACGILLKMTGAKYDRVAPTDKVFDCQDKYALKGLTTKALTEAKLGPDRVSTANGTFVP
jgi:ABC-type branched-subunit amino acid transport system substrate-binding protein